MSRIYDALKKLEAERARRSANGSGGGAKPAGGNGSNGAEEQGSAAGGDGGGTGGSNGSGGSNGHGNGKGRGSRGWRWLFPSGGNGHNGVRAQVGLSFDLLPEAEDAYQRLGTNLLVAPGTEAPTPRVLGLTACRHGEGTTTTAAIFGSVLVRRRGGRVVLVEANLRSPSLDAALGIRRDAGLADLIQGRKSIVEVAQQTEIPNLFAIPAGHSTLAAPALFDSSGVVPVLNELRTQFEFVLVDLPPANVYADTLILAPRLDGVLIVIEADRARIPEVERLRRNLDRVGVRLVGSILNRRRDYIPAFLEELL